MDNGTNPKRAVGSNQCGLEEEGWGGGDVWIWIQGRKKGEEELMHLKALSCDITFNVGARLQQMVLTCCWFSSWELGHAN